MNYYKSTDHPFNKGINFVYLTANGDFFYYGTEEFTDDISITEEEYNLEVAKEEHVEPTPIEPPVPDEDLQAEMLLNQIEILVNQEFMEDVLSQILLNQMEG